MGSVQGSSLNDFIKSYKVSEQRKRLTPLESRKNKYSTLNTAWGDLKSQLNSFKSTLAKLKVTTSSSIFNTRSASLSNTDFLTASAEKNASVSGYNMRVDQLAKSDLVVSNTMASADAVTTMAGTHNMKFTSGEFFSTLDVELQGSETNASIMNAISNAINDDYAVINSTSLSAAGTYTGSGAFDIDLDGTTTNISYDYTNQTYEQVVDDLVNQINGDTSGITAEKVTDGGNVSLKLTVDDKEKYISVTQSGDTGNLLSTFGIDITKEKAASAVVTSSVFSPTTDNAKISFTAKESGYDNRLIMSDESGSAFNFLGLTSGLLSARTQVVGDDDAGFMYDATSSTVNDLNSKMVFNGINIQRNSNSIDDLVPNVTFDLKSVMEVTDNDVVASVKINTDEIKGNIQDFIKQFNGTYTFIKNRTTSDSLGRGVFVGEATASSLLRNLTSSAIQKVSGIDDDKLNYLSEIGITFEPGIGLTLDDASKLDNAINNTPDQVEDIFNSENGIATNLYSIVDGYLGSSGTISNLQNSYDKSINYLADKITATNTSIDRSADVLRKQYERLQETLFVLQSTQKTFQQTSGDSSNMQSLESDIEILKSDLSNILFNLDNADENTFDEKLKIINQFTNKVMAKREEMSKLFPKNELVKFNDELNILVKLIIKSFDNVITKKSSEQEVISLELKKINNRKKLANYGR